MKCTDTKIQYKIIWNCKIEAERGFDGMGWFVSTFEGSTLWKFLTTEMTRSVTSALSRKVPLTSSEEKQRRTRRRSEKGTDLTGGAGYATLTLRCLRIAILAAAVMGWWNRRCWQMLPLSVFSYRLRSEKKQEEGSRENFGLCDHDVSRWWDILNGRHILNFT